MFFSNFEQSNLPFVSFVERVYLDLFSSFIVSFMIVSTSILLLILAALLRDGETYFRFIYLGLVVSFFIYCYFFTIKNESNSESKSTMIFVSSIYCLGFPLFFIGVFFYYIGRSIKIFKKTVIIHNKKHTITVSAIQQISFKMNDKLHREDFGQAFIPSPFRSTLLSESEYSCYFLFGKWVNLDKENIRTSEDYLAFKERLMLQYNLQEF